MPADLGPDLTGLSPHLIAHIVPLDREGNSDRNEPTVFAPIQDDASITFEPGWQGTQATNKPETSAPALASLAQSGGLSVLVKQLEQSAAGSENAIVGGLLRSLAEAGREGVDSLRGRTGLTKLNSTLYFGSMAPVKIGLVLYFGAYSDPLREVEAPIRKLMEWAVPQELSESGTVLGLLSGEISRRHLSPAQALLPSVAPRLVGLQHSGAYYGPYVIESLSIPITSPRDKNGNRVSCSVQMTLASLQAPDMADIRKIFEQR